MKKPLILIALLTLVSCNQKNTYEQVVEEAKAKNQCMLEELIAGHDSTVACIICDEKLK